MALHFCTYFDQRHIAYGLALYQSLVRCTEQTLTLFVLCLDDVTFDHLQKLSLPGVRLIRLADLEEAYPSLVAARKNRDQTEYYFTLTPALPCHILKHNPEIELLAYVDADLYFYSYIAPIYKELGDGSILIVPYRHPVGLTYNVGLLVFRNDEVGRSCLAWWRERCDEWCYRRFESGKFADEGYLEDWPTRFQGVKISQHNGVGFAPWNAGKFAVSYRDGAVFVDSDPLVFCHFGAARMTNRYVMRHNLPHYRTKMTRTLKNYVYVPYIRTLRSIAVEQGLELNWEALSLARKTLKTWVIFELFFARLVIFGPWVVDLNFGTLGSILVGLRKRIIRTFSPQEKRSEGASGSRLSIS